MKKATYRLFIICFSILAFMSSSLAVIKDYRFLVEFGLMEKGEGCYHVCNQTRDIPFITNSENKDFSFGYTIEAKDASEHKQYIIIYLPRPIKKISDEKSNRDADLGKRVLKSKTEIFKGSFWGRFTLNDTDPKGKWTIKIFVDDRLLETIIFNVQSTK